jgi:hypothetical protein
MSNDFGSKATSGLCQAIIALMPPHALPSSDARPAASIEERA